MRTNGLVALRRLLSSFFAGFFGADRYGHLFPRGDDSAELAAAEKAFL